MAKRGRPPRAEASARARADVRLTLPELRAIQQLARLCDASVADTLRLAACDIAADLGAAAPVLLGTALVERLRRIVADQDRRGSFGGQNSAAP